jgi:F0F1-type ATP synthase delta subunit
MCDQLNGRLRQIDKFGPPRDMDSTFHTLIYSAPRIDVEELSKVRSSLEKLLGKEFVKKSDMDESCINKIVCLYA